jgi:hypothetical protein
VLDIACRKPIYCNSMWLLYHITTGGRKGEFAIDWVRIQVKPPFVV